MTFEALLNGKIACNDAVAWAPAVADITAIAGVMFLLPLLLLTAPLLPMLFPQVI
jgi:hypothetical protein